MFFFVNNARNCGHYHKICNKLSRLNCRNNFLLYVTSLPRTTCGGKLSIVCLRLSSNASFSIRPRLLLNVVLCVDIICYEYHNC